MFKIKSYQFSSVAQSCPSLCGPMNRGMPGLPVRYKVLEFTQIHVHRVGDAIQPSYPLSPPSPPAPNPSQHQGLFRWVNSLHDEVTKVLELQLQHQSFQWTSRTDLLQDGLVGSPCSPRGSRVFSNTIVQNHQFFGSQLSSQSNSHIHTWPLEKPYPWLDGPFFGKVMSLLFNILSRLVITFLPRSAAASAKSFQSCSFQGVNIF